MHTKIWDNFTRIYHMSQLILLALLWYSGEQGDFDNHFIYGYLLLSLLIARISWGIFGSETSKFSHFLKSPIAVWHWLKKVHTPVAGHNPVAGYMVVALIILLSIQLFSGLFATDDVLAEGPLLYYVSDDLAESLDSLHRRNFDWLLALIALHAIAAFLHSFKADNVVRTILTGKSKELPPTAIQFKSSLIPLAIWFCMFGLFAYLWLGDTL
ncbi:hydrogenase [Thalassotalea sp. M1531]|uniref:Hydrogenase n=1 Tax=Thalassotalea algicola TaxID=2716224 RepID=A0A7Y0L8V2_9GAMM|nr:cytochrome b/b6 domain-containing protein [Thalassotalea algicola]NMP29932.1 hydrogenase [Thalassotalea algicola]